ncbi:MAG: hypothetical protein ABI402_07845 [Ferruginibacter sp.]
MKQNIKLLLIFIISLTCKNAIAQNSEVIDNSKLIEFTNQKFGDDLIISFIKSSQTNFNCSNDDIIALKKQNVSEKVLVEVMNICGSSKAKKEDSENVNNPVYKHPSGLYVYENWNTETILQKLYATVVSNERRGGAGQAMASRFTYGLAKSSATVQINGEEANVKIKTGSDFYFYFEPTEQPNLANWWFTKASSPNEFTLIKLKQKRNNREFTKGKSDSYTYQTGIDEDQKIQFDFEEVKPGIFKVKPKSNLKEGEYCFIYSASVPSQYSNDKVFDFSVIK